MKIAIGCGGRDWGGAEQVRTLVTQESPDLILSGGARGADSLFAMIARECGISFIEVPANWKKFGRAAGPKRNHLMIDIADDIATRHGAERVLLAMPGGSGTAHMTRLAAERNWRIVAHQEDNHD